jgi:pantetheine-phosphate adenylyltransferase|uniref:Phosphopantetheine adenylyltransferase n=1 Tax=candidate division WOR-3 bacterium TaxID=2052148 RepID=A0A7V3UZ91_UNCW3
MRKAVYPGSFDPITLGHLDIIERASRLFDQVIVAVAKREEKNPLFSWEERIKLAKAATAEMKQISVEGFDGLLVEFVRTKGAGAIIRGLRAVMDFDYEFQMALTNRKLAGELETVFFLPSEKYFYLSSSLVRELARAGARLDCFAPAVVVEALKIKFRK